MAHALDTHRALHSHGRAHVLDTRRALNAVVHVFERILFVITGLIFIALGVVFCWTIVLLPLGLFAGFGGVLLLIGGLLADFDSPLRDGPERHG